MRIIDFERKGNLVRFYLGNNAKDDYCGDGWDKLPYSRAEQVNPNFVTGITDFVFPFDVLVLEPESGEEDCSYSKDDMKAGIVPCIIAVPSGIRNSSPRMNFSHWSNCRGITKFYFGDYLEPSPCGTVTVFDGTKQQLCLETLAWQPSKSMHTGDNEIQVPLWEKNNLTIDEAALYFGIGKNKIRELTDGRNCNFVLLNGTKRLIKRKAFEKYLEGAYSL